MIFKKKTWLVNICCYNICIVFFCLVLFLFSKTVSCLFATVSMILLPSVTYIITLSIL